MVGIKWAREKGLSYSTSLLHQIEKVRSGVPATTRLLARDVLAVNPRVNEDVVVEDQELQQYGLQQGAMGLPETRGRVRREATCETQSADQPNTPTLRESDQEDQPRGAPVGDEQPQKRQRREIRYDSGDQREVTDDEDVIVIEEYSMDAFKPIPAGRVKELEGQDFWPLPSSFAKLREDIVKGLATDGVYEVSNEWLHCNYGTERASLSDMAAAEERIVRRHTRSQNSFQDPRLWMMLYTLVQQAVRCDPYLYALTVAFWNDGEFELLGLPEPAWARPEEDGGILQ